MIPSGAFFLIARSIAALAYVDKSSGKLVQATSVRYQGVVDGVVEQRVRDEIAVWKQENFLRPLPCFYFDDFDTEAIKLGVKSAPPTTSQRSGASTQNDYHDMGLPVLELQKLLKQIGAYAGKLDGWFGDKMKAAVELLQMHAEKGEFTDGAGNPVRLPEEGRLAKEPRGGVTVALHESAKVTAAKKLKIKATSSATSYFDAALGYEGAPYLRGGMNMQGIDCSGLVLRSVGETDRNLWTTSGGNPPGSWSIVTPPMTSYDAFLGGSSKGDLFLWSGEHAAYYAGGVRLFHAHGKAGTPTDYTSDLKTYWLPEKGYPTVYRQR
jgi:cell wall-associated NlpC family hydrolase